MAVRPYWKGYLKLSLVTCAVTVSPATTDSGRVRFHTLNRKTGDRIFTRFVDAASNRTVDDDAQAKGYEKADGDYVLLEDDELDAVKLESVHTVDIDTFVDADSIEWVYYDSPYFMVPADEVGEEAFTVIREAMASGGVVGISRLVLAGREHAVMLQPWDNGIILWTLRYGDEVRDEDDYFKGVSNDRPDPEMLSMVEQLIDDRTSDWSLEMVRDPVQRRLLDIIKSKRSRPKRPAAKSDGRAKAEPPSNVIDLMAALKQSLERKPARPRKSGG